VPTWERPTTRAEAGHRLIPALLIAYSLAAIRGLLAATVLARTNLDMAAAIARDLWRRVHQTRATISHYHRRGDPLPPHLRM
jgi:hypothetical protein